jgi:hypothetical protein
LELPIFAERGLQNGAEQLQRVAEWQYTLNSVAQARNIDMKTQTTVCNALTVFINRLTTLYNGRCNPYNGQTEAGLVRARKLFDCAKLAKLSLNSAQSVQIESDTYFLIFVGSGCV